MQDLKSSHKNTSEPDRFFVINLIGSKERIKMNIFNKILQDFSLVNNF